MIAPSARKLALLGGSIVLASTMTWRPALANGFDHGRFGNPGTVKVYCGHGTIKRALTKHPLRPLVIVVNGVCAEDVTINRDRVTLLAANPRVDGITGVTEGGAAIAITGARSTVIEGLRLRSAPGGGSSGIFVTANGEATVHNALIEESGYGIWANHGGFFHLRESEIKDGREYGILMSDGANARVENSIVAIDNSDRANSAAIGAFRSVNIRLRGANLIANSGDDKIPENDDDGFSLDLYHNVEFRQDGGHSVFVGPMEFGNLTHASLRDSEIAGGIDLFGGSRVDIRDSRTGSDEITGGRPIAISSSSHLELRSGVIANAGSIGVFEHSVLNVNRDASVTAEGNVDMDNSTVRIGENASMAVNGDLGVFERSILTVNRDASVTAEGNVNLGNSTVQIRENASVTVNGDFGAFSSAQIAAFGPNAKLDVSGYMNASEFLNMHIGENSSLVVGEHLQISDFSLMYAGNHADINADMNFGGSATKVNFLGDGVNYTGKMHFSEKSDMNFGPNNNINGFINCNGSEFFAVTPPNVISGGFVMCP